MSEKYADITDFWRRLGLEELYEEVRDARQAMQLFEEMLTTLPKCQKCARAALLHNLQETGDKLSVRIINLGILSRSLKDAVKASERVHAELKDNEPPPCRCSGEPCKCHD